MVTPIVTIHLEVAESTQDEARARFSGTPILVTAASQTAGRGRSGASWENASRALAASVAFAPGWPDTAIARITLVAGLAALEVVGGGFGLKWPNDLTGDGGKAGGILTERFGDVVVVGLGVNLWWPDAPEGRMAVHDSDPGPAAGPDLGTRWATSLLGRVARGPAAWGRDEYRRVCLTIGHEITWEPGGRGVAVDVATDGGLVVATATGREVLSSGAVTAVRPTAEPPSLP